MVSVSTIPVTASGKSEELEAPASLLMRSKQTPPRSGPVWRLWYTLRHHRPMQLIRRLRTKAFGRRMTVYANFSSPAEVADAGAFPQLLVQRNAARRTSLRNASDDVAIGRLTFLGATASLGFPFQWQQVAQLPVDHLWRFHLHYQEYLLDMLSDHGGETSKYLPPIWDIVQSWVQAFPRPDGMTVEDAWHPFCISRRLPIWMMLWHHTPPPIASRTSILDNLCHQAAFLAANLEQDPGGNHLLENLRTLILASVFLEGDQARQWGNIAERHLRSQLPEQTLPTGEHFERTPTYHSLVLELLLEVRDAVRSSRPELAAFVDRYIQRMGAFLKSIVHPDGEIPLLSDSALGPAPLASVLLARAGQPAADVTAPRPAKDYWTWRHGQDMLLFDAGPAATDRLPAHAHCDLLGMEASVGARRLFVDGGVYDYGDTEMRRYCRGTSAHNTIQVDDVDQFDVWSRFRMGYRGQPQPLQCGEAAGFQWAQSSHNAYRRLGAGTVGRWIGCRPQTWVCLDWAMGNGTHKVASRLRIHPEFNVMDGDEPGHYLLSDGSRTLHLRWLALGPAAQLTIEQGWYCPEFGIREPIPVLTWSTHAQLPMWSGWALSLQNSNSEVAVEVHGNDALVTYIPTEESVNVCLHE